VPGAGAAAAAAAASLFACGDPFGYVTEPFPFVTDPSAFLIPCAAAACADPGGYVTDPSGFVTDPSGLVVAPAATPVAVAVGGALLHPTTPAIINPPLNTNASAARTRIDLISGITFMVRSPGLPFDNFLIHANLLEKL
jgi:hypothetical protein